MEASQLAKIILAIICFGSILLIVNSLFSEASNSYSESACRSSVLLRGAASYDGTVINAKKVTPLACSSEDIGELEGSKDEQRETIANHAATCWWMFAEGSIDNIFSEEAGEKGCHICYRFRPNSERDAINGSTVLSYMKNHSYDPGLLKGGGTHHFIGDDVNLGNLKPAENQSTINLASYDAPSTASFVNDATGYLSDNTVQDLNDELAELALQTNITGQVVIAHQIENHNRQAAQNAMEELRLTQQGNHTKGFLLTVSLADDTARLDAGRDLSSYFSELTIASILKPYTTLKEPTNIGDATSTVIEDLQRRIYEEQDRPWDPSSYFGYLHNGRSMPLIGANISPSRTYAVAYVAPSDYTSWFGGVGRTVLKKPGASAKAIGGAAGGALVAYFSGGTALSAYAKTLAIGGVAGGSTADSEGIEAITDAATGNVEKDAPSYLMIVSNNKISHMCDD